MVNRTDIRGGLVAARDLASANLTVFDKWIADATGSTPTPPVVTPPPQPTPGSLPKLTIGTDFLIHTPDTKRFIPGGTCWFGVKAYPSAGNADGQMSPVNLWHLQYSDEIAAWSAQQGVNWVRLLCAKDDNIIPNIKKLVTSNAKAGIYTMLCGFDLGGFGRFDRASGTNRGQWLAKVWNACDRTDAIIMNPSNEPFGIDSETLYQHMAGSTEALRAAGYTGIIFHDGNNWAHTASVNEVNRLGDKQCGVALHAYAFEGNGPQPTSEAIGIINGWVGAGKCCKITGEWGPYNGGWGGSGRNRTTAVNEWCVPFATRLEEVTKSGEIAGGSSWMLNWDGNAQIDAAKPSPEGNMDWWGIVSMPYPNFKINEWGVVAKRQWAMTTKVSAAV
jgi:hypothetical protein